MLCMQEEGDDNAVYTRGRQTIALCLHYDNAVDILCSHYDNAVDILCSHYDSTVLTRRETITHTHELNV
jgi:hypothetical protein